MAYEISDNGNAIKFVGGGKVALIYKQAIKQITLIHDDVIRCDSGDSSIVFHHTEVGTPSTPTPEVLIGLINDWISNAALPPI